MIPLEWVLAKTNLVLNQNLGEYVVKKGNFLFVLSWGWVGVNTKSLAV